MPMFTYLLMHGIFVDGILQCSFRIRQHAIAYLESCKDLGLDISNHEIREIDVRF